MRRLRSSVAWHGMLTALRRILIVDRGGNGMAQTHDRRFVENHPDLAVETVTAENAKDYQVVLDSVSYVRKYSGTDGKKIDAGDEAKDARHIYGIYESLTNEPVGWIQYCTEFDNKPFVFVRELFIRKEYQRKGYGKAILEHFLRVWKADRMEKAILDVDLKNWAAIRFLVQNGFEPDRQIHRTRRVFRRRFSIRCGSSGI